METRMKNQNKRFSEEMEKVRNIPLELKAYILKQCNISEQIYMDWSSGRTLIPKKHHEKIAEIFNLEVSEMFPPEELYQRKKRKRLRGKRISKAIEENR